MIYLKETFLKRIDGWAEVRRYNANPNIKKINKLKEAYKDKSCVISYSKIVIKIYSHLSLNEGVVVLVPVVLQSFYCNYTLCKTYTFLRRTMDTFETVNGQLGGVLCSEKHLKTVK